MAIAISGLKFIDSMAMRLDTCIHNVINRCWDDMQNVKVRGKYQTASCLSLINVKTFWDDESHRLALTVVPVE